MTEKELKELAEAAKVKADSGDKDAQFNLGFMFENGQGVLKDYDIAVKYYTLAGDSEHIGAIIKLADIYRYGRPGVEKNEALAKTSDDKVNELVVKKKLEIDAEAGDVGALRELATMYRKSKFVKNDEVLAKNLDTLADQLESAASKKLQKSE